MDLKEYLTTLSKENLIFLTQLRLFYQIVFKYQKKEVQIFDYVDYRIPVFDRMYQNRLKGYQHLGYSIKQNISENAEIQTESKLYSAEDYNY